MRETDGRFRNAAVAVIDERGAEIEEVLMDVLTTRICLGSVQFDTTVCPNLAGDVLSDLVAGLAGDLGLLSLANTDPDAVLFEPVRGSTPDIVGEGVTNSAAMILSTVMLLDYLGHEAGADRVRSTVEDVLADGSHTPDLGGDVPTEDVTTMILDRF